MILFYSHDNIQIILLLPIFVIILGKLTVKYFHNIEISLLDSVLIFTRDW